MTYDETYIYGEPVDELTTTQILAAGKDPSLTRDQELALGRHNRFDEEPPAYYEDY